MLRMLERIRRAGLKRKFASRGWSLGEDVQISVDVVFNCKSVAIGDGVRIGERVVFNCDQLAIGDFATIYSDCFFPGPGDLTIGHNFWLGKGSIIDSAAGTMIGNNVGVGAASQLWTHMKYGDIAAGCRFHSQKPLVIEDDVWLVGHVLVSPVHIGRESMAMLGSLITRDMEPRRVYAGVPAHDVTERLGGQFEPTSFEFRRDFVREKVQVICSGAGIADQWQRVQLVERYEDIEGDPELVMNLMDRTYIKRGSAFERLIIRSLLPDAKFVPRLQ